MRSNKDRLSGFPGEYPGRPTGSPGVVHREKKKPVENSGRGFGRGTPSPYKLAGVVLPNWEGTPNKIWDPIKNRITRLNKLD